jgi:hypothetical protein
MERRIAVIRLACGRCSRAGQIAAMTAGELLARARHVRPRLVPGEEPPAAAVAERIGRMSAEELQGLVRGLREPLAAEA